MRSEVLSAAAQKKIFLSPDALEMVLSNSHPMEFINTVLTTISANSMFVDKKDIMDCIAGDKIIFECPKTIAPKNKKNLDLKIMPGTDVTGESTCEGKINDFANFFKSRFYALKKLIESRRDFGHAMPIEKAIRLGRETKIIGMIYEKKDTKNGHVILKLEDDTGMCTVLISKDSPNIKEIFVTDEVIGVSGKSTSKGDLFIADEIFRPDIPKNNNWIASDSVSSVAFLSDVHVGSYTFLKNNWEKMIQWLKTNAYDSDIDYLVFPGDIVDGIGIFPGQEEELDILDIYKQYETLANYLKEIPDHIQIVIHPGNHDAVRLAEPQPALNEVFTKSFDSNIMMVSNPINIKVEGRTLLSYHGKSIDDWISGVQQLTYDDPIKVMEEMLKRRHLAPMYGQKTALAPEKKDYLVMENIPDIFVSGHVHGAGTGAYRGIKMINASAWQGQTEYQKMHNFNPDPAIMPIVHLGTGKMTMKNFNN
ncbi:MAG: DNA-directed DNA polymerase II small subunit [Candidatus Methanomethylophilaceae archaeon]|nr:DNA-directed DNA polymerase II small subunit [Candidatus Methanomethylophilaceae archaeon]MDD3379207.1 DNA-directed DNA polymerase II small subunit [Candidatus Methanomethylophilaceae archaeon]MDY0223801.1 DNA-directed DNA polymerase II small subunit [Candidatus Methanomethylophilaceae archaeon]